MAASSVGEPLSGAPVRRQRRGLGGIALVCLCVALLAVWGVCSSGAASGAAMWATQATTTKSLTARASSGGAALPDMHYRFTSFATPSPHDAAAFCAKYFN